LARRELNPQPPAYKADALTSVSYAPFKRRFLLKEFFLSFTGFTFRRGGNLFD